MDHTTLKPTFEMKSEGRMPIPSVLFYFMLVMFGLPAVMLFLTTIGEVFETPWLVGVYLVSWFPIALLFFLKWALARYAVRLYMDRTIEILYPFKTVRVSLHEVTTAGVVMIPTNRRHMSMAHVVLGSADGATVATFSANMFDANQIERFFVELIKLAPQIAISRSQQNVQ